MAKAQAISGYKDMVKKAKLRLQDNNSYNELCRLGIMAISGKSYILNSKIIKGEELFAYYKVVSSMVSKGLVANAIGALIDNDVYNTLTPSQREKYVFTLGIMFRELKEEYEKQALRHY